MKKAAAKKSSFTLSPEEVPLVNRLKKELQLKSRTAVIRKALHELENKVERDRLREQFRQASKTVQSTNRVDMNELDQLADEGL